MFAVGTPTSADTPNLVQSNPMPIPSDAASTFAQDTSSMPEHGQGGPVQPDFNPIAGVDTKKKGADCDEDDLNANTTKPTEKKLLSLSDVLCELFTQDHIQNAIYTVLCNDVNTKVLSYSKWNISISEIQQLLSRAQEHTTNSMILWDKLIGTAVIKSADKKYYLKLSCLADQGFDGGFEKMQQSLLNLEAAMNSSDTSLSKYPNLEWIGGEPQSRVIAKDHKINHSKSNSSTSMPDSDSPRSSIASLTAEVATVTAERDAAQAKLKDAKAKIAALTTENTKIPQLTEENLRLHAENEKLKNPDNIHSNHGSASSSSKCATCGHGG